MSIMSAIAVSAARIAKGVVLAAVVYLVNRGVKHPLCDKKVVSNDYRQGDAPWR